MSNVELGFKAPGDKQYKHPEYSMGFYKAGGVIPGSSFVRGDHPKTIVRNSMGWKAFAAEFANAAKRKTYEQLHRERILLENHNTVQNKFIPKLSKFVAQSANLLYEPQKFPSVGSGSWAMGRQFGRFCRQQVRRD